MLYYHLPRVSSTWGGAVSIRSGKNGRGSSNSCNRSVEVLTDFFEAFHMFHMCVLAIIVAVFRGPAGVLRFRGFGIEGLVAAGFEVKSFRLKVQ